jgi:hypothetical protein
MDRDEMKLMELESEQLVSEKFWKHEYVIDRVFLMRADISQISKIAQVSLRYRAKEAKLRAEMLNIESQKFEELSKMIG